LWRRHGRLLGSQTADLFKQCLLLLFQLAKLLPQRRVVGDDRGDVALERARSVLFTVGGEEIGTRMVKL
jgi:hypothetical protein